MLIAGLLPRWSEPQVLQTTLLPPGGVGPPCLLGDPGLARLQPGPWEGTRAFSLLQFWLLMENRCAHIWLNAAHPPPPAHLTFPVPQTLRQSREVGDGAEARNNKRRTGLRGPRRLGVLGSMGAQGGPAPLPGCPD